MSTCDITVSMFSMLPCSNSMLMFNLGTTPKLTAAPVLQARGLRSLFAVSRTARVLAKSTLKPATPEKAAYSGVFLLTLTLVLGTVAASIRPADAVAQSWRFKTPRDTIKVMANSTTWTATKLRGLPNTIEIQQTFTGTFGMFPNQQGKGFDAKYAYMPIPGFAAPTPIELPPSYNGKKDTIYLAWAQRAPTLGFEAVKFRESSYQPNHVYTSRNHWLGTPFEYKIIAKRGTLNSYYSNGTGFIQIALAQFTAGISMKSKFLEFGNLNIGQSKPILDSIASYGVDPLQIDSISITGSKDFRVVSQRGNSFTLPNEGTNELKVIFSPSSRGNITGVLNVYCRNTDGANQHKVIQLKGFGVAPSLAIGPSTLDFGKQRVNRTVEYAVNIWNGGNGTLNVNMPTIVGDNVFTIANPSTLNVGPGSNSQIKVRFAPKGERKYRAVLHITGNNVPKDSVILTGEGAEPRLVLSDTLLDFGPVRRGDKSYRDYTLWNVGTYAANIISLVVTGPNPTAYSVEPNLKQVILAAGDSIKFRATYYPLSGPEGSRTAYFDITLDDGKPARRIVFYGLETEPKMIFGRNAIDFGKVKVDVTKSDTLSLINFSNAKLNIGAPPVIIRLDAPFEYGPKYPMSLEPKAKDTVQIRFTPDFRGTFTAWYHMNVNGQKDSVFLSGIGVLPKPVFTPAELDFGTQPTNMPYTMVTILTDTGDYQLDVCNAEIVGKDKEVFTLNNVVPKLPYAVQEFGSGLNFFVQFKTMAAAGLAYEAWLKVTYCDGTADSIRLKAKEQAQFLEFGQRTVNFGKVRVKSTEPRPAMLSNGSNATLTVAQLSVTPSPGPFSVTTVSQTVDKKSTKDVMLNFTPPFAGQFTGYLHGTGGDMRTDSIQLVGIGAAPKPRFLPDSVVDFGTAIMGSDANENLEVSNEGNWWMKAKITIENDPLGEFSIQLPDTDSIGEGRKVDYPLTFTPKEPMPLHTADLKFTLDDSSIYMIKLIARDESNFIALDRKTIDFGKVRIPNTPQERAHLVNTSLSDLAADDVSFIGAAGVFTASVPSGQPVSVTSKWMMPIDVTFAPAAMQPYSTILVAKGANVQGGSDTIYITGVGAMPVPRLSSSIADFGILTHGTPSAMPVTLSNVGNWEMPITRIEITGAHRGDYSVDLPSDTTLDQGGSRVFTVSYLPVTPMQTAPRDATLEFTLDDGTKFQLPLTAQDKAPLKTDIGFSEYLARPGDKIYAVMRLRTRIPDHIVIRDISGTAAYDPALVDLVRVERMGVTLSDDWSIDTTNARTPGAFTFSLASTGLPMREIGGVLRFVFEARKDLVGTAQSPLHLLGLEYNDTREAVAELNDGAIIIDSSCGSTHVVDKGSFHASFIQQNNPNPFGASIGSDHTVIPYEVGFDGVEVSIRILDNAGRQMLSPLENKPHNKGQYQLKIDAKDLSPGIFFYEFRVKGSQPVFRKMVVAE